MKVATDIGGTFTDLVYLDPVTGRTGYTKASSTPPNFAQGILDALDKSPVRAEDIVDFVHGCTVVINALTERNGARTALITTEGFRDVLEIGRGNRPDIYNFRYAKQPPFVPREWRFEVRERLDWHGRVLEPLDEEGVRRLAAILRAERIEAVAICFLHAYANPVHEQRCREILAAELPDVFVSISSDITKEWREYERTSTVVLNAYVQPVTARYLNDLETTLRARGVKAPLYAMKSNGGTNTFALSRLQPIHLVESGPVGGVIGAKVIGDAIGEPNLITIDVGGTTAKTSLIDRGVPKFTTDYHIERDPYHAGYPIKVPVVDIVEIGAGGGSIAWVDEAGALKVGPRSAGAVPGPAAYGRGGDRPTVTDANLVTGRINPRYFLGGELVVYPELAQRAFEDIARHFGVPVEEAALGVIRVADANMMHALRLVSVRRGYDPRDFAILAMGGGGPMHAGALLRELGAAKVIIPPQPGTFSAWGMLVSDPVQDFIQTKVLPSREDALPEVAAIFDRLYDEAQDFVRTAGYDLGRAVLTRYAYMRYVGQEHTVPVLVDELDRTELEARFHANHERTYTFALPENPVEFVTYQVRLRVAGDPPNLSAYAPRVGTSAREKEVRPVYFEGGWVETVVYERSELPVGFGVRGPAIVEEPSSTTVVHPGECVVADQYGNLILTLEG
jgi:N-methylhydantoinase A